MLLFHRRVQRVSLGSAGILIAPVPEYGAYSQDFLVYCAGPLVNLLLGAFAWSVGEITAAALHLGLGALNLLPYSKLDGGAVCRCLLEMLGISQDTAERCMQLLCGAVTLFLLLAVKIFSVKNVSIPAMTVYLELTELLPVFGRGADPGDFAVIEKRDKKDDFLQNDRQEFWEMLAMQRVLCYT